MDQKEEEDNNIYLDIFESDENDSGKEIIRQGKRILNRKTVRKENKTNNNNTLDQFTHKSSVQMINLIDSETGSSTGTKHHSNLHRSYHRRDSMGRFIKIKNHHNNSNNNQTEDTESEDEDISSILEKMKKDIKPVSCNIESTPTEILDLNHEYNNIRNTVNQVVKEESNNNPNIQTQINELNNTINKLNQKEREAEQNEVKYKAYFETLIRLFGATMKLILKMNQTIADKTEGFDSECECKFNNSNIDNDNNTSTSNIVNYKTNNNFQNLISRSINHYRSPFNYFNNNTYSGGRNRNIQMVDSVSVYNPSQILSSNNNIFNKNQNFRYKNTEFIICYKCGKPGHKAFACLEE